MELYLDLEKNNYVLETELLKEFKALQQANPEDYADMPFIDYVHNRLWKQGGTLDFVGNCGEYVKELQDDIRSRELLIYNAIITLNGFIGGSIDDEDFIEQVRNDIGISKKDYLRIMELNEE